jgi:hypothetical protein
VEAGSNTSTVTLRVVGGDEREVSSLNSDRHTCGHKHGPVQSVSSLHTITQAVK